MSAKKKQPRKKPELTPEEIGVRFERLARAVVRTIPEKKEKRKLVFK